MAIPPNARAITRPLDPSDWEVFTYTFTQGAEDANALDVGEEVGSFSMAPTAEAVAAGLVIGDGTTVVGGVSRPAPVLVARTVTYWATIAAASRSSTTFNGSGLTLATEINYTTTAATPRIKQKTITNAVANQ